MYAGFDLQLETEFLQNLKTLDKHHYQQLAILHREKQKQFVQHQLNNYMGAKGSLDGTKLESDWFPQISSDIFLSHSHGDEELALTLAGLLWEKFGLSTFIDSTVWGYADNLLKQIDNTYCLTQSNFYNYDKRNGSTSHVHMMLAVAIGKMMDKTECLFFLNTPNSVQTTDSVEKTKSAWVYYEIATSKIIRRKKPQRYKKQIFSKGGVIENLQMSIEYSLRKDHLYPLTSDNIYTWLNAVQKTEDHELDVLYGLLSKKFLAG